ncbi:MAG: response regulator [Hymenobacteraceae bacterium]|nr:response regulator [Hymenobacteraceae bacterium]
MTPLPCVLLVDDDPTTNFLNTSLLKRLGAAERILVARDGQEALTYLQEHCVPLTPACPVLILLDVNMPGMNGVRFLEAYQHLPIARQPEIVVIMLSTSIHPRDIARVREINIVADFVSKPLTAAKITELLQTYFSPPAPQT